MATLRCRHLLSVLCLSSMAVLLAAGVVVGDDAVDQEKPRAMMRMPEWVETFGGPGGRPRSPRQPAERIGGVPVAHGVPAVEAKGVPPASKPGEPAKASASSARGDGVATRAVLQAAPGPAAAGRLTAEWTEFVPTAAPAVKPAATPSATPRTETGQPSPLKRWLSEKVGGPAKSATEMTDAAGAAEAVGSGDQPRTTGPMAPGENRSTVTPRPSQPTITAPVAAVPDEMPSLLIDPASFRGVHPGKTTTDELRAAWGDGEAFAREDGSRGLFWKIEPFERVEVTIENDVVSAIRIKLAEPVAVGELAKQLEIAELRTVSIIDEQGVSIGEVFPERGVIFSVKPGTQSATAVMVEPLDPESFVLRAEGEIDTCTAFAVADLEYAVQIDPRHQRAHRLLMVLMCEQGKWRRALELAEAAIRIDPKDMWSALKRAKILLDLDRPADARAAVETVKAASDAPPLVAAQVERLLGRIDLAGDNPDHQRAVEHFAEAIRRASALLTKRTPAVQHAAREILLDAHLGTAQAIAQGTWQQKGRVIPKWITRSEAVVAECKAEESVRQTMEMQLCRGALAVAAGSAESFEPLPWVKRLLAVRESMSETVKDPWRRRQIDWDVGLGLLDALAAAQLRGDAADALDNATLTAAYLERGGEQRELTDKERKDVGDLLFRIGIMHSLQRGDHATAVTWFDRVVPLWEGNPRRARAAGELGESYISMAISYWQVDRREDAMALSRRGVELMVAAVDQRQLDERSLAVAYGNLSTMYAEQGDEAQAQNYAEMASRAEASGSTLR